MQATGKTILTSSTDDVLESKLRRLEQLKSFTKNDEDFLQEFNAKLAQQFKSDSAANAGNRRPPIRDSLDAWLNSDAKISSAYKSLAEPKPQLLEEETPQYSVPQTDGNNSSGSSSNSSGVAQMGPDSPLFGAPQIAANNPAAGISSGSRRPSNSSMLTGASGAPTGPLTRGLSQYYQQQRQPSAPAASQQPVLVDSLQQLQERIASNSNISNSNSNNNNNNNNNNSGIRSKPPSRQPTAAPSSSVRNTQPSVSTVTSGAPSLLQQKPPQQQLRAEPVESVDGDSMKYNHEADDNSTPPRNVNNISNRGNRLPSAGLAIASMSPRQQGLQELQRRQEQPPPGQMPLHYANGYPPLQSQPQMQQMIAAAPNPLAQFQGHNFNYGQPPFNPSHPAMGYQNPYQQQPSPLQQYYHQQQMQQHMQQQMQMQQQLQMQPHIPQYNAMQMMPSQMSYMPQQQQFPGNLGFHPAAGPMLGMHNPQSMQAMQQMQKMTEQLEAENAALMMMRQAGANNSNINNGSNNNNGNMAAGPGMGSPVKGRHGMADLPVLLGRDLMQGRNNNAVNGDFDGQSSVGRFNGNVKMTKADLKNEEELRAIEYELEKVKKTKEIETFKMEFELEKKSRIKESEREMFLADQKQELAALKLKQAIAKEKKMLAIQTNDLENVTGAMKQAQQQNGGARDGAGDNNGSAASGTGDGDKSGGSGGASNMLHPSYDVIRHDSGVGYSEHIQLDLIKSLSVLVDGVLVPKEERKGELFRVAVGLYDSTGKVLVKLTSSDWQSWSHSNLSMHVVDDNNEALHYLENSVVRTLRLADNMNLRNSRCLMEIQYKNGNAGGYGSLGWGLVGLTTSSAQETGPETLCLQNSLWRANLRSGVSDATYDLAAPALPSLPDCYLLLRIVDGADLLTASAWSPQRTLQSVSDIVKTYRPVEDAAPAPAPAPANGEDNNRPGTTMKPTTAPPQTATGAKQLPPPSTATLDAKKPPGTSLGAPPTARPTTNAPPPTANSAQQQQQLPRLPTAAAGLKPLNEEEEEEPHSERAKLSEDTSYWIPGAPLGPCTVPYEKGEGVDFYVDGAQFLPDNVTATRLSLKFFTSEKEKVLETYEIFSTPSSDARAPSYNFKVEARLPSFNVTTMALIRMDAVDCVTLKGFTVGYTCIKVFSTKDRQQPKTAAGEPNNMFINTGLFQLPWYSGKVPTVDQFDDQMFIKTTQARIPCASLLVRIYVAPKSEDGIMVLSKEEHPQEEWAKLGLDIPKPLYRSGQYSGLLCEPQSPLEHIAYQARLNHKTMGEQSVEGAILQAMSLTKDNDLPNKPPPGARPAELIEWLRSLFPGIDSMKNILNYAFTVPYSVEAGVSIAVDSLFNMPDRGLFATSGSATNIYKVIYSLSPPGLFYKDPPLNESVAYTQQLDWQSHFRSQRYLDGFVDFRPPVLENTLYLIVDVRTVKIDRGTTPNEPNVVIEPPSVKKSYWTMLPLAIERIPGQGFKYLICGVYQLPLIEGPVPSDLFRNENPFNELLTRLATKSKTNALKLADGAPYVLVRVVNPCLKDVVAVDRLTVPTVAAIANAGNGAPGSLMTGYMQRMLQNAASGLTGPSGAKIDVYAHNPQNFPVGGPKAIQQVMPKTADLKKFQKIVNKAFTGSCGLPPDA